MKSPVSKSKKAPAKPQWTFRPSDLVSISQLCEEGLIPKALRTVRALCKADKFPAVKEGREWKTTRSNVRQYFVLHGNKTFLEFVQTEPKKP